MAITSITSVTISADCKTLTALFQGQPTPANYTNEITGVNFDSASIGAVTNVSGSVWKWEVTSALAGEVFNGVITIDSLNGSGTSLEKYAVGTCELDCCIATLVNDAINCTCECDRCDEDLHRAEKVHLLAESAKYSAINDNVTDAINKYTKAKEFCTEVCACGC
jgi:hypothetical protein